MIDSPWLFFYQKAQFFADPSIINLGCAYLGNNRYIDADRQPIEMVAKEFPNQALDSIALNSPTNLATNGQSKASEAVRSMQNDNDKVGRMPTFSPLAYPLKITGFSQMARFRKGIKAGAHVWHYLVGIVTTSLLRPRARRRRITDRPFLLCIRARKPWVLFLQILLG